jgi:hypothetical protein
MDATSLSRTMVDWDQVRLYNVSSARRLRVSRKKRTWPARDLKLGAFLVQHITLATVAAGVAPAVELWRRARRKKRAPKIPARFACALRNPVRDFGLCAIGSSVALVPYLRQAIKPL